MRPNPFLSMRGRCEWAAFFSDHAMLHFLFCVATPQKKNKPAAHLPDVAQPRPDQSLMSSSPSSSSSSTGTKSKGAMDLNPAAAPADPNGILSPPSAASPCLNSAAISTPGSNGGGAGGNGSGPQVVAHNATRRGDCSHALLTGTIILLAGRLALHHRSKTHRKHDQDRAYANITIN
jgi:hypothetical protein